MHNNVIIGLTVLTVFTLSIMLALYGLRIMNRDRQWRPRRYGVSAREVPCSFCGKVVRAEAVMCRHCRHRLDDAGSEQGEGERALSVADGGVTLLRSSPLLAAGAAVPPRAVNEDLSENQTVVWLDNAFAQLALKEAPAVWGPAAQPDIAEESRLFGGDLKQSELSQMRAGPHNEVTLSAAVPGRRPKPHAQGSNNGAGGWKTRERVFAGAIASVALIIGGSAFLDEPLKSRVEPGDDFVTFDVSERAPLYAGPEGMESTAPNSRTAAASAKSHDPATAAAAPMGPAVVVNQVPVVPPRMEQALETSNSAVGASPEFSSAVTPGSVGAKMPTSPAAITPLQSTSKSDQAEVPAAPREDWASTVARAIQPAQSRDLVIAVQRLIRAEGYDPGLIDGIVGPRTRTSILAYQRNGGLRPTGMIDRELLQKLNLADRTVRVIGPSSGVAPSIQTAQPPVEWTK